MNRYTQYGHTLLLILLSAGVVYLIFFKKNKNLDKALERIDEASARIEVVQDSLTISTNKVRNVLSEMETTKSSIDSLSSLRANLISDVKAALRENRRERRKMEKDLLKLEEELNMLRAFAQKYQP
ncbi:MAG: hypothetical protein AAF824_04330 [Bacteroidota bacterium]